MVLHRIIQVSKIPQSQTLFNNQAYNRGQVSSIVDLVLKGATLCNPACPTRLRGLISFPVVHFIAVLTALRKGFSLAVLHASRSTSVCWSVIGGPNSRLCLHSVRG